ncbi:MAG TPA: FAD-linked oxidase C-terminal domain-containing protein [Verrucomicrobiae bacterium]|nr:FAD-linked oxidase C-terminal domain-containing protein [Verrucomicrobiae bacterium]
MTPTQQHATLSAANCEVKFDNLTRQLYATDASHYQIEPLAVAFPRDAKQASSIIQAAQQAGVSVIPRGAGTGLVGGAIGEGVVVDFSRYNRLITEFDVEKYTVRVGAGVVLDQLNGFLRPQGYAFGPDVATSSRATIGGMIANNSSGARCALYGTTVDHVVEVEVVMSDGKVLKVGPEHDTLKVQRLMLEDLAMLNGLQIGERFPEGLLKRWPGYALDRVLREPANLINVLAGSEGTLAAITSAVVRVVPTPDEIGLALIFFDSIPEAMQASVELADLKPSAIEFLDRMLLDQTRGQREFQAARDLLELDARPAEGVLAVEFYGDVEARMAELEKRPLGSRKTILQTLAQINHVWTLRKGGLSLLTSCKGRAKPVTCIEDAAVRPKDLPAYYNSLSSLIRDMGLEASFYGHAASGLLHVRPVLDLQSAEDLKKFREITEEVAALVKHFKGSFSAEHGVGMGRTEFLRKEIGDDLYLLMRQIKRSFDPHNLFNPGKLVDDGRFKLDKHLRQSPGYALKLPFEPMLAFSGRDGSFVANLEQCNGCGGCRKETPTMCPTFLATGEEIMSTRGRANTIRAALELRGMSRGDALSSKELEAALSNCLSCKACINECPSNVNLALLKAELQWARIRRDGLSLRERLFGSPDFLGRLGCAMPKVVNDLLTSSRFRELLEKITGISAERALPRYAKVRFDWWFERRQRDSCPARGRVILWDDTFVRYNDPHIGIAAVKVLEAAGYEVQLATERKCCGRPAFSQGNLGFARKLGAHNLKLLSETADDVPIIFLEPSCYSMFIEDYREMNLPDAQRIAARCHLFEEFLDDLLRADTTLLEFNPRPTTIAIHVHCHAKALTNPAYNHRLASRLPGRKVHYLDTGCCGMAGGFGMMKSKYELSLEIAKPLIEKIRDLPYGSMVVASGASCRHQIEHLAPVRARHMAEVLADALE